MTKKDIMAEAHIKARGNTILDAARVLIGTVRATEYIEHSRSNKAELSIEVQLTEGGFEEWRIEITRTASSH